jgi:hypothetical protein
LWRARLPEVLACRMPITRSSGARAAEARVQAEQMTEVSQRGMMALIADLYEKLTEQAEQRVTERNRTNIAEANDP